MAPSERIEVEGDKPKIAPTRKFFAALRAGLKTSEEVSYELERQLQAAQDERDVLRKDCNVWREIAESRALDIESRDQDLADTRAMRERENIPADERVSEIKQRAHYFADRQEITPELYRDICWLAERASWLATSYEWQREALEKIAYSTWSRDMGPGKIAASMHAIAAKALAETKDKEAW